MRPCRSVLFLPASNARAIEKARTLPVDVVILDLEDAVGPDDKVEARDRAVEAVAGGGFGNHQVGVRINGLDTAQNRADMPDADPGKWVQPSDLARVMLFLASPESRAVTGALIPVTGRV